MRISFLLHLYQPVSQDETVFRKIVESSYIPLIKKIEKSSQLKVSLDLPLSLLEQMDKYGYTDWIESVKSLVNAEKIELVGSAAYHPLLSRISAEHVEKQVVLNEYSLAYYFGRHKGFEGEDVLMVKDLRGFFPPEMAIDEDLLKTLSELKYEWVIVDESALPNNINFAQKYGVYKYKDYFTQIVVRNRDFSNVVSFKRDLDMADVHEQLNFCKANDKSFAIAIDGEFFGHHYEDGFLFLEDLLDALEEFGIDVCTVSEYIEKTTVASLEELNESSWGSTDENVEEGKPYILWDDPSNKIQKVQWEIYNKITQSFVPEEVDLDEENPIFPIWIPEERKKIENTDMAANIEKNLTVYKALQSDCFWWASNRGLPTGQVLYSADMIRKSNTKFLAAAKVLGIENFVKERVSIIESFLV